MFFCEEKIHKRFGADEIDNGKADCYHAAEHSADTSVFFGEFFVSRAEAAPDQRYCRGLQSVSEGEGKSHNIHTHLMSGHSIGSLLSGHDSRQHEADSHKNLLKKNAVTNFN